MVDLKRPQLNVLIRAKISFVGFYHLTRRRRSCSWVLYHCMAESAAFLPRSSVLKSVAVCFGSLLPLLLFVSVLQRVVSLWDGNKYENTYFRVSYIWIGWLWISQKSCLRCPPLLVPQNHSRTPKKCVLITRPPPILIGNFLNKRQSYFMRLCDT